MWLPRERLGLASTALGLAVAVCAELLLGLGVDPSVCAVAAVGGLAAVVVGATLTRP